MFFRGVEERGLGRGGVSSRPVPPVCFILNDPVVAYAPHHVGARRCTVYMPKGKQYDLPVSAKPAISNMKISDQKSEETKCV